MRTPWKCWPFSAHAPSTSFLKTSKEPGLKLQKVSKIDRCSLVTTYVAGSSTQATTTETGARRKNKFLIDLCTSTERPGRSWQKNLLRWADESAPQATLKTSSSKWARTVHRSGTWVHGHFLRESRCLRMFARRQGLWRQRNPLLWKFSTHLMSKAKDLS